MKNKPNDVPYCGVDSQKVNLTVPALNTEVTQLMWDWIRERYLVHLRKDIYGAPAPWTNDPVIANFRFTNVRREHDKETRWVIANISLNNELSLEEKVLNSVLFRSWNRSDTFVAFGGPFTMEELSKGMEYFRDRVQALVNAEPDRVWYTPAFNTGGLKQTWRFPDGIGYRKGFRKDEDAVTKPQNEQNIPLRMFRMIEWVIRSGIHREILNAPDQEASFKHINSIHGYGPFLAYQVFVDLTYISDYPFSENEFVVCGPGCRRGVDLLFENRNGLTHEEAIFWLRDNQCEVFGPLGYDPKKLFEDLPKYDRTLNVMSVENIFCELTKYVKASRNQGRPRQRYQTNSHLY